MPNFVDRIYFSLPYKLKVIAITLYSLKEAAVRNGKHYREAYKSLSGNIDKSHAELEEIQRAEASNFLEHVLESSPYYKKKYPLGKADFDALCEIEIMPKPDFKSNIDSIKIPEAILKTSSVVQTSGTTGTPMRVDFDAYGRQRTFAEWRRYYDWLGLPQNFRSVRFSGRLICAPDACQPPFWVRSLWNDQLFMSSYHLSQEHLWSYVRKLNSFKPNLIDGYPSAIRLLADYILDKEIELTFQPIAISLTAETLTEESRNRIEKAFGCKVYNQYASSEGAPWLVECREGALHSWTDTGVFEFDNSRPYRDGTQIADLIVTSFRSRKTPLLRYKIGDCVEIYNEPKRCICGSGFPVEIKTIIGREDDLLYTREKGYVGRLDPVFKGINGVERAVIIQKAIDLVVIEIIADIGFDSTQADTLKENLKNRLGESVQINTDMVDEIKLGANGKFRAVQRSFDEKPFLE